MAAAADLTHPDADRIELVEVLAALGHPARLEIVRKLASGEAAFCGEVVPDLPRSSVTHHLKTLRESGVICQQPQGRRLYLVLRRDDLERRFPGLLELVLTGSQGPGDGNFPGPGPAVGPAP
ncbi:helix-turn-helix transcriptional regulator [Streptomyces sp. ISL-86]|uniref:ArsR/SmtB family transcription factor n=1 Tax=Streptomyces sp. ISL-86 TaxID=2819187 RepID=UPI001BE8DBE0|nr:helix-turn-helix domain-containing protein [Streptomyces sp. ISL-86]MBT2455111.1 helix-turn-helix transcriptional regulator [Streptomyces sp. ISL-86]